MKRVLIAMSGGVDSSVAGLLCKKQGWDCIGCTMLLRGDTSDETCGSSQDVVDAQAVAECLNMPFQVCDFTADFKTKVIDKFVTCYEQGITPNPCIDCNRYMKFEKLYQVANNLGCDVVVTGHYARIEKIGTKYYLKKAVDVSKDQSYFLYHLTAEQLAHTLFPLGNLTKSEVREIAQAHNFKNAHKRESQDICFVPSGDYAQMITNYTGKTYPCGNFVNRDGEILGQHRGIIHYTIGQRKGLSISANQRLYVCDICPQSNTVCLCERDGLLRSEAIAIDFHWINGAPADNVFRCHVKIRYNQKEQPASIYVLAENQVRVVFDEPQRAVTSGQALVLYQGDIVLGGGVLTKV